MDHHSLKRVYHLVVLGNQPSSILILNEVLY